MTQSNTGAPHRFFGRFCDVIDHVYAHLDDDLSLDRLADIACLSPFHFHRIYHALTGETLAETVRRLRFHRAAGDLLEGHLPMQRVALRAGYSSEAAFNRAFKKTFGLTPGHYRNVRQSLHAPRATTAEEIPMPNVTIQEIDAIDLLLIRHQGDYMQIGSAFEHLNHWAASQQLLTPETRSFGLYWDDPSAVPVDELRAAACMSGPANAAAGEVDAMRLNGGRYACLLHVGPYAELEKSYDALYRGWLPQSGEEPADAPCAEEYLNNPRDTPPMALETLIMMPLANREA